MSTVFYLRQFVNERLTAAAEEIFGVFEKTIVEYEEEIDRQRRLLDIVWKPDLKLHRIGCQQKHVCNEEEVLSDQQICEQERNSCLDQEDPEPPQIKEELCTTDEEEQLGLKQEINNFMFISTCEESYNSNNQILDSSPGGTQNPAEAQPAVHISTQTGDVPEPNCDNQLLFHSFPLDESQDPSGTNHDVSGSDRNADLKPMQRLNTINAHSNIVLNSTSYSNYNICRSEKSLKYGTCRKIICQTTALKAHVKTHTAEKQHYCQTCGKCFKSTVGLLVHMRTHTGEKPYPCNICGKPFRHLSTLIRHMRIHNNEKPYSCETCGRDFRNTGDLKIHMRTHTGERPYPCNTCGKRFGDMSTLRKHKRIHTGEKPYPCNTCEKSFGLMSTLRRHMKTHTASTSVG